jgi:hypothetical protein
MPKTKKNHTTNRKMPDPDTGADPTKVAHLAATMDRLRALAATASALVDSSAHPDQALFDQCDLLIESEKRWRAAPVVYNPEAERLRAIAEMKARYKAWMKAIRDLTKLPAQTPEGLYAKAVAARSHRYVRERICSSLIEDLVNNADLRAVVWPAAGGGPNDASAPLERDRLRKRTHAGL